MEPNTKLLLEEFTRKVCEEIRKGFLRAMVFKEGATVEPDESVFPPPVVPAPVVYAATAAKRFALTSFDSKASYTATEHALLTEVPPGDDEDRISRRPDLLLRDNIHRLPTKDAGCTVALSQQKQESVFTLQSSPPHQSSPTPLDLGRNMQPNEDLATGAPLPDLPRRVSIRLADDLPLPHSAILLSCPPAHSAKQPTRPPQPRRAPVDQHVSATEQFPDGMQIRLQNRVRGVYIHADEDWVGVSLSLERASLQVAWQVHQIDHDGSAYVYDRDDSFKENTNPKYHHDDTHFGDNDFRDPPWLSAEAVSPYYDGGHVFFLLYRELGYWHALMRLSQFTDMPARCSTNCLSSNVGGEQFLSASCLATTNSSFMVTGGVASNVLYNLIRMGGGRRLVDYDIALLFQPCLLPGVSNEPFLKSYNGSFININLREGVQTAYEFCRQGFVLGKSPEAGCGNEMYKILTAAALSIMLNRSLIIGQTRGSYPSEEYISYIHHSFTVQEAVNWALKGVDPDIVLHMRMMMNRPVQARKAAITVSFQVDGGNTKLHTELEELVATFVGTPMAILVGMGYVTDSAAVPLNADVYNSPAAHNFLLDSYYSSYTLLLNVVCICSDYAAGFLVRKLVALVMISMCTFIVVLVLISVVKQRCRLGSNYCMSYGVVVATSTLKQFTTTRWQQSLVGSRTLAASGHDSGLWRKAEHESWTEDLKLGNVVFHDDGSSTSLPGNSLSNSEYADMSDNVDEASRTRIYTIILVALRVMDNPRKQLAMLMSLLQAGCKPDLISVNIVIHGFAKAGSPQEAKRILDDMLSRMFYVPEVVTFTTLISGYLEAGDHAEDIAVLDTLMRRRCSTTSVTYNCLLKGLFGLQQIDTTMQFEKAKAGFTGAVSSVCIPTQCNIEFLCMSWVLGGEMV